MRNQKAVLGIDVGGTYSKVCLLSLDGDVLGRAQLDTLPAQGPESLVRRIGGVLDPWLRSLKVRVIQTAVGIAGDVDAQALRLRYSPNLKGWERFDLAKALSQRLRAPVTLQNDANMAVWGGYVLELGRKYPNVAGITLGTGVGGGLVLGGRLYVGSTGSAGEVGHTCVQTDGWTCHCGQKGCLEAYAGSCGIVRMAREALKKNPGRGARLAKVCGGLKNLEPKHLSAAANLGDTLAQEIWGQAADYIAIGLAQLVMVLNPDVLLILGGVARAGKWLETPLRRAFERHPFKAPFGRAKLHMTADGDLGCMGAALYARENKIAGE